MPLATPLIPQPAVTLPMAGDAIDDAVKTARDGVVALNTNVTAIETRLAAVESRAPALPTPVVTVVLTAAQEAQMATVGPGSVAILRGAGADYVVQRA